jgi:chromosome partitioning protein
MRRIAIINQKGGVGKTTTAVNLAAALAECGQRVCVLDLDPQAHATTHLGIEPDGKSSSMYDVLVNSRALAEVRRQVSERLWIAASDINLAAAEVELAGVVGREVILRDLLLQDETAFDIVLMDSPAALPGPPRYGQAPGNNGPGGQAYQPGVARHRHHPVPL